MPFGYEESVVGGIPFWGRPWEEDFWRCRRCGIIFFRRYWFFERCPWCQSAKIEEYGSFFLRPRARKFLKARARIS